MTPHLNCLDETVQMRGTTYGFDEKSEKLSSNTPSYLEICICLLKNMVYRSLFLLTGPGYMLSVFCNIQQHRHVEYYHTVVEVP